MALSLIVMVAGVGGFVISYFLLHHGFGKMFFRYPVAVCGGYVIFLGQLRIWVEIERGFFNPAEVVISRVPSDDEMKPPGTVPREIGGSWLNWLDAMADPEGCLVVLIIGLIVAAASLVVSFIMAGPELLAEVFLDAVVVTMFYRHLKTAAREHWLGTAVRRTWISALLTAVALAMLGGMLDMAAPNCHSIGPAMKAIFSHPD